MRQIKLLLQIRRIAARRVARRRFFRLARLRDLAGALLRDGARGGSRTFAARTITQPPLRQLFARIKRAACALPQGSAILPQMSACRSSSGHRKLVAEASCPRPPLLRGSDDPHISDRPYDILYVRLRALEKATPKLISPDSPPQRVGRRTSRHAAHRPAVCAD